MAQVFSIILNIILNDVAIGNRIQEFQEKKRNLEFSVVNLFGIILSRHPIPLMSLNIVYKTTC